MMRRQRMLLMLVVLLGMGGMDRVQAEQSAPPESCRTQPYETKMECYQQHLETVLQAEGTEGRSRLLNRSRHRILKRCARRIRSSITSASNRLRGTGRPRSPCRIAGTCSGPVVTMACCKRS